MTDAPFTDPWSEAHRKGLVGLREWLRREGDTVYWQADIAAALAEIDRLTAPCRWTRDQSFLDESDKWDTACDRAFTFIDGGPRENNYTHCPGCGRGIEVMP